ncbi:MAG: phage terminase large subunit [Candidatus Heimdallarchaeaceae archaeon]
MSTLEINLKPNVKQKLAYRRLLDKETRFVFMGGAAGGGKSWLGAEWIIAMSYKYPGTKWFIGRKELKRLMASSVVTFYKVLKWHNIPKSDWKLNGQYNYLENTTNGSRIDLLDLAYKPTDPDFERLGSLEYTGGWIEEAGEIHFKAFDVLKTRVGRHENTKYGLLPPKILGTLNPSKEWVYRIVYKPWKEGSLTLDYSFIPAFYYDNPHTAEEYGKQLEMISDPVTRARLKDGNWDYDDDENALIKYESILDLFTNVPIPNVNSYLTADIARYGSDKTVIGIWMGLDLIKVIEMKKLNTVQVAEKIKEIIHINRIPRSHVIVDEDGIGGGVVDQLPGVKGFIANTSPIKSQDPQFMGNDKKLFTPNYKNLKTQCSYMLADKVNNHELSISGEVSEEIKEFIVQELQQIKRKITPDDSKLQLVPKQDIKDAIGRSPDYSDMMMMRMAFDVKKEKVFRPPPLNEINQQDFGGVNFDF